MKKINAIIILLSFTFTSCMHMFMMGGHNDHNKHQAETISKEVQSGDYTISVSIKPMAVGKIGGIEIKLKSKNNVPENVEVHYMISKSEKSENPKGHDHQQSTSSEEFKTIHQNIVVKKESSNIIFTPTTEGSFVFTLEINSLPNNESPISIEVPFQVSEKESSKMMGMGGMMNMSENYMLLSAVAMLGMMIVMWSVRGNVF